KQDGPRSLHKEIQGNCWTPQNINGTPLIPKDRIKYLGTIIDSELSWKPNVEERAKKATNALYASQKMLGSTWGVSPRLTHWIFISVVRPILLYGALVWSKATEKSTYLKILE
ncbi:hypothetical protein KR018_000686, partial [Drosophila ironensis]